MSLPEGTVHALREMVGNRGVSALVAAAVEEHLRNRATASYLDEYEREHGAFSNSEKRTATDIWSSAERREAGWRAAG
ncbi:hypothetical protein [Streptosporangium sp. NPDC000396]|uniref:hypothetical protein n=1 Tax=Streptosporangium sp. NPDC000396 TaxID=3366185 RepID=UPI00367FB556